MHYNPISKLNSKAFATNLLKSEIQMHDGSAKENAIFSTIYLSIFSHLIILTCLHYTKDYSENANEYPKSI